MHTMPQLQQQDDEFPAAQEVFGVEDGEAVEEVVVLLTIPRLHIQGQAGRIMASSNKDGSLDFGAVL